jgi:hypothetical protein
LKIDSHYEPMFKNHGDERHREASTVDARTAQPTF